MRCLSRLAAWRASSVLQSSAEAYYHGNASHPECNHSECTVWLTLCAGLSQFGCRGYRPSAACPRAMHCLEQLPVPSARIATPVRNNWPCLPGLADLYTSPSRTALERCGCVSYTCSRANWINAETNFLPRKEFTVFPTSRKLDTFSSTCSLTAPILLLVARWLLDGSHAG